jgi:hypothetical protein
MVSINATTRRKKQRRVRLNALLALVKQLFAVTGNIPVKFYVLVKFALIDRCRIRVRRALLRLPQRTDLRRRWELR